MNHQQSQPSAAPRLAGLSKDCDPCRRSLECTSKSYLAVIAITTLPPSVCAQGEREGSRCAIQVLYGLFSSCIGVKVRCRLVSHQPPPPWILLREAVTRTNNRLLQGHVRPMFVPNLPLFMGCGVCKRHNYCYGRACSLRCQEWLFSIPWKNYYGQRALYICSRGVGSLRRVVDATL